MGMNFPPTKWVAPDIIPEGLTILAGRPKVGKSWLVLDLGVTIATSGEFLGHPVGMQGDVLYLALEDSAKRLNSRLRAMRDGGLEFSEDVGRLELATQWPRFDQGGLVEIERWISKVKSPTLVGIDTLAMLRPPMNTNDKYAADYAVVNSLHDISTRWGVPVIVTTHQRKMDAEDPIDTVQGSLGITGAADTILVLAKDAGRGISLYVRGRDVEENTWAVEFNSETMRWNMKGEADAVYMHKASREVLKVLQVDGPLRRVAIAKAVGKDPSAVGHILKGLSKKGLVQKDEGGLYSAT
jgi:RecA-family ATPase